MSPGQHHRYDALINAITTQAKTFAQDGVPAAQAARVIAHAITTTHPRTRYTVGKTPRRWCDWPGCSPTGSWTAWSAAPSNRTTKTSKIPLQRPPPNLPNSDEPTHPAGASRASGGARLAGRCARSQSRTACRALVGVGLVDQAVPVAVNAVVAEVEMVDGRAGNA